MAEAKADLFQNTCLKFKGNLVPLTTLELYEYAPQLYTAALREKVEQAPKLFHELPIILSLDKFEGRLPDLLELKRLTQEQGLYLVGIRSEEPEIKQLASQANLPIFPVGRNGRAVSDLPSERSTKPPEAASAAPVENETETTASAPPEPASSGSPTKVITQPIRSGQQIYAQGGDLIVLAPVSAGAEVLADGNIHVYAPLRGRALAGVKGQESARIFCQSLEAELISIAGHYKISEDLQGAQWKEAVQISLDGEKLSLSPL